MRIYFLQPDGRHSGPHSLDDVRDHLDLRLIKPSQPCRIAGRPGAYVAGELVSGNLFAACAVEEDDEEEEPMPWEAGHDARDAPPIAEAGQAASDEVLWHGHPGYAAFPLHILVILGLTSSAVAAWFAEWSGWLATGLGALACFALALLLARRQCTLYVLCENHLECHSGIWLSRVRELPRSAVEAMDVRRTLLSALRGRGDLVLSCRTSSGPAQIVFRCIFRPGRVRRFWRD